MNGIEITSDDAGLLRTLLTYGPTYSTGAPALKLVSARLAYFDAPPGTVLSISYRGRHALRKWDDAHQAFGTP
jgi:hypothetical protein